jgi:hypothetical protein
MSSDHIRGHYCVKVDGSVKLSDVTSPKFWRHIKALQVNDLVEVLSPTLDILLRVTVAVWADRRHAGAFWLAASMRCCAT